MRRLCEGHSVAERGEPLRVVAGEAVGVEAVEVLAAQLAIRPAPSAHLHAAQVEDVA